VVCAAALPAIIAAKQKAAKKWEKNLKREKSLGVMSAPCGFYDGAGYIRSGADLPRSLLKKALTRWRNCSRRTTPISVTQFS
jgi:hypothetical protein